MAIYKYFYAIILVFNIFLFNNTFIFANDCYHETYCDPDKLRPYQFCVGGQLVIRCVHNPYSDAPPGYKPLKAPGRMCISIYYPYECQIVEMPITYEEKEENRIVFYTIGSDYERLQSELMNSWSCLCMLDLTPCACTIPIYFSSNPGDFHHPSEDVAAHYYQDEILDQNKCEYSCMNRAIYLNITREFTGGVGKNDRRTFFTMEPFSDNYKYLKEGYRVFHLEELIQHEMGHLYGLCDYWRETMPGVTQPYCESCQGQNDLMAGYSKQNQERIPIVNEEECYFKMLYCKDLPGCPVPEKPNSESNNKPNPANTITTIDYCAGDVAPEKVVFELYSQLLKELK